MPIEPSPRAVSELPLVDHHCHGVVAHDLDRDEFEQFITESDLPAPHGTNGFDSQIGFAIRRYCAPLLDLPAFATADAYIVRRRELGADEVNRRLLQSTGISDYLVETGFRGRELLPPAEMARAGEARAHEIVRLESLAEQLVDGGCGGDAFPDAFRSALDEALDRAVGVKSIAAYRVGLDFDPRRPEPSEVVVALTSWIARSTAGAARLDDPVVVRHLLWEAVDRGCAIQFHTGYGDPDADLQRSSPLLLTEFMRLTRSSRARIMLLHCYPFHREAGYLAQLFPHVYLDVGLALSYTGSRSHAVIAESMELAPFSKLLFSSDAFGVAELYAVAAMLFRRGTAAALSDFGVHDGWPIEEQERIARLISAENALRVYGLAQ